MRATLVLLGLLFGRESLAEPPTPAEEAFEAGRRLAEAEHHERACAAFELSQRLDPQFGTQFNLAGCYVSTHKLATAWRLYRQLARSDSNAQRRVRAAELATQLEAGVPSIRVRVRVEQQTPELRVFVGETEVTALLDTDLPFDAGHYVVTARLPGYLTFHREIDLEPKEVASVDVDLVRGADAVSKAAPRVRSSYRTASKLVLAGSGGILAFAAFGAWRVFANRDAATELCGPTACIDYQGAEAATDRARLWRTISWISGAAGAVGVIGGVLLWRASHVRSARLAPSVTGSSAAVVVGGAF